MSAGRYLLDEITPLPVDLQQPEEGTFFTALLSPDPDCWPLFPKDYCEGKLDSERCIEVETENGMSSLQSEFDPAQGREDWSYKTFCEERHDFSTCGKAPHPILNDQLDAFGDTCDQTPQFDVLGFATFTVDYDTESQPSNHADRFIKFLSFNVHSEECDFAEQIPIAAKEGGPLPCISAPFAGLLTYGEYEMGHFDLGTLEVREEIWHHEHEHNNECTHLFELGDFRPSIDTAELLDSAFARESATPQIVGSPDTWRRPLSEAIMEMRDFRDATWYESGSTFCSNHEDSELPCRIQDARQTNC